MNFLSSHFLQKNAWPDVSKSEWAYIVAELNGLLQEQNKKQKIKKETDLFGTNYLYEHLIINKLKAYKGKKDLGRASKPNLSKLSRIVQVLGYDNYIDFINSHHEAFNFNDLKIGIPKATVNTTLAKQLI